MTPIDESMVIQVPAPAFGAEHVGNGRTYEADVAIVGTGPGGAAVARVLAEAGARVVLLEEGPAESNFRPNYAHTARFHMQERGAMVATGNNFIPVTAGRGVGGSTLINGALCFRCPDAVLDSWATLLDDDGYSAQAMRPIFDEVAALIGVAVTPERIAGEHNLMVARGAQALGLDGGLAPRNTPGCIGCGVCYYGCPSGGKASTNVTLLPRATAAGAIIQAETRVTEVLVAAGRAVGLRGYAQDPDTGERGGTVTVKANQVVLSAGAIGTPRLLWSCGLGSELGPVGEGLHLHPGTAIIAKSPNPVHMWKGATQGAYFHVPGNPKLLPHTISLPPEAALVALGLVGPRLEEGLELLPNLAGLGIMISDKSAGRVRAKSDGRANISYSLNEHDVRTIIAGCRIGAEVMLAGGAEWVGSGIRGSATTGDIDELAHSIAEATVRDITLYAAHPMSSCRMGKSPDDSVVYPSGAVHRLPGLSIADASVFPTSLGVNPQLTTLAVSTAIGRRLADSAR